MWLVYTARLVIAGLFSSALPSRRYNYLTHEVKEGKPGHNPDAQPPEYPIEMMLVSPIAVDLKETNYRCEAKPDNSGEPAVEPVLHPA